MRTNLNILMSTNTTVRKLLIGVVAIAIAVGAFLGFSSIPQAQALTSLDDLQAGQLIRGESLPAVYYLGVDGLRYVFPNDKAYFTWYDNFDTVVFISDSDLTKIQIGGNVRYRPGVRMVKIQSDPTVFVVEADGVLRPITTEEIATALYGADWNQQIDDIPDGFFGNYTINSAEEVNSDDDYDVDEALASAETIEENRNLAAPKDVTIDMGGYNPTGVTIEAGQGVRFINNDTTEHTATADDLSWGTGTLQPGGEYIRVFSEAGEYPFFDSYDSGNTGAVIVE